MQEITPKACGHVPHNDVPKFQACCDSRFTSLFSLFKTTIRTTIRITNRVRSNNCPHHQIPRRFWSCSLFFSLALLFLCQCTMFAAPADDDFDLAVKLYNEKNYPLASKAFEKYLKDHKGHKYEAVANLYLAMSYSKNDRFKEAHQLFASYQKNYPTGRFLADASYQQARCSFLLKEYENAETEYEQFMKLYPNHNYEKWVLADLGETKRQLKKYNESVGYFDQSLRLYPNGPNAVDSKFGLSQAYRELNKTDEARRILNELIKNPNSHLASNVALSLGELNYNTNRFSDALLVYDLFLKRHPRHEDVPKVRLYSGFCHYQLKEFKQARQFFGAASQDPKLKVQANFWSALSYKYDGELEVAVVQLKELEKDPGSRDYLPDILFHWADCERRLKHYQEAERLYFQVHQKHPTHRYAKESLLSASESAYEAGDFKKASEFQLQFTKLNPPARAELQERAKFLQGRLMIEKGDPQSLAEAIKHFEEVREKSKDNALRIQAYLQLARIYQRLDNHEETRNTLKPLVEYVHKNPEVRNAAVEALVFDAVSAYEMKKYDEALNSVNTYLVRTPKGIQAEKAWSLLVSAEIQRKNIPRAKLALERMTSEFPASVTIAHTMQELANLAFDEKDWNLASELFTSMARLGKDSPYYAAGLSGLGWCRFQQQEYQEAITHFTDVSKLHPKETRYSPEAFYMIARCHDQLNQSDQAAIAYQNAFRALAPKQPVPKGQEGTGQQKYAWLSGLQAARAWWKLKKIDEADKAYEDLLKTFPEPEELDLLLDEWALMNYQNDRFQRSDVIFQRLVKETPNSPRADDAWLNLAESDLEAGKLTDAEKILTRLANDKQKSDLSVQTRSLYHLTNIAVKTKNWNNVNKHTSELFKRAPQNEYEWEMKFRLAEAHIQQNQLDEAQKLLEEIKSRQANEKVGKANWFPDVFVFLAEIHFRKKDYPTVQNLATEFRIFDPDSPLQYKMDDVLGRSYKNQADFEKSRSAFRRVIQSEAGKRTETAARSQFMIAETFLLQENYQAALLEYLKVETLYAFPLWQTPALYQAGQCHETLQDKNSAIKTYQDLVKKYSKDKTPIVQEYVKKSEEQLAKLGVKSTPPKKTQTAPMPKKNTQQTAKQNPKPAPNTNNKNQPPPKKGEKPDPLKVEPEEKKPLKENTPKKSDPPPLILDPMPEIKKEEEKKPPAKKEETPKKK